MQGIRDMSFVISSSPKTAADPRVEGLRSGAGGGSNNSLRSIAEDDASSAASGQPPVARVPSNVKAVYARRAVEGSGGSKDFGSPLVSRA